MIPGRISVIICTHNPDTRRLTRVLHALMTQTVATEAWELILVDNGSDVPVTIPSEGPRTKVNVVRESRLGLTQARRTGAQHATGEYVVFVDDDNVLAPDYLEKVFQTFARLPRVGAIGGKSHGEFERPPHPWQEEFYSLLAVRDLGTSEQFYLPQQTEGRLTEYPTCAPIGAGMALRRTALESWLLVDPTSLTDRRGDELSSAGDNDIVLTLLHAGWAVAYVPELKLRHLIPRSRLEPTYLEKLNRGIQKSWMVVLSRHGINPWPRIPTWSVKPRQWKAWLTHRAWRDAPSRIRWQGACGHFEGRAESVAVVPHPVIADKLEYLSS